MIKKIWLMLSLIIIHAIVTAQIPKIHNEIGIDEQGQLYMQNGTTKYYQISLPASYTLEQMVNAVSGTNAGFKFDFKDKKLQGTLYYGFINHKDGKYPQPVFFKKSAAIKDGISYLAMYNLKGRYDMVGWQKKARGVLGYRVVRNDGVIIYDGKFSFRGSGPFRVGTSIVAGPFVNMVDHQSVVISFDLNVATAARVYTGESSIISPPSKHHEVKLSGLQPATTYVYSVKADDYTESYSFTTAPQPGTRKPFVFAYASDSRSAQGGGERNIHGVNSYIIKKIMALTLFKKSAFMQFTGDMISGYLDNEHEMMREYYVWKRTIEPFAHYVPVYAGMGNHEALLTIFDDNSTYGVGVDKFPFATVSAEAIFARCFVHPVNGPESEDNSTYDPDLNQIDFPSYKENVFYYTYDNVAMIVLNSNYWFSPSCGKYPFISGNLHSYLMDNQLLWLTQTLKKLEQDVNIDFIFVTQHTPAFPNGGHAKRDMWYYGNNAPRAVVAGKPVAKGIIERRDEYLLTLMKNSTKVVALLTGDEHNYNRMRLTKEVDIYPADWGKSRITASEFFRPIWQINNGAAGAPYYAQEKLPWSSHVKSFSTQNALVFFYVHGKKLRLEVINPDTLDTIDTLTIFE